ncbi:MAG: hypothetical protein IK092_04340, partial [Muribaculaceae bacterium]|nr:hypothetical protein [Muribaculaceae bacterium]
NEARNVVASARSCYTVDAALSCKNKASSLLGNSYIMRSDIKAALSAVPQVAKKTCAGAIKNRISGMAQYDDYGSRYLSPENEQQAWNWLNSYKSALGIDSNYNEIYSYIMQLTD